MLLQLKQKKVIAYGICSVFIFVYLNILSNECEFYIYKYFLGVL